MLYQTPRFRILTAARKTLAIVTGALGAIGRTGRDTAYVDGLNDFQLRDIGLTRIDREIRHVQR